MPTAACVSIRSGFSCEVTNLRKLCIIPHFMACRMGLTVLETSMLPSGAP